MRKYYQLSHTADLDREEIFPIIYKKYKYL